MSVEPHEATGSQAKQRFQSDIITIAFVLAAIAGALLQAWVYRYRIYIGDSIVYLDMADAFFKGDWSIAINSFWSPLYPLVAGALLRTMGVGPDWEFAGLKVVNLIVFVALIASFQFFLSETLAWHKRQIASEHRTGVLYVSERLLIVCAWSAFLWVSLAMGAIYQETPDQLMECFTLTASALLIRLISGSTRVADAIFLGVSLGLGFLAKTIMFPISFVYLGVAALALRRRRLPLKPILVAFLSFVMVAAPFIGALSFKTGQLNLGRSGPLNYLFTVTCRLTATLADGDPALRATIKHPPAILWENPRVFGFGSTVNGTYPPLDDPCYFYEGVRIDIDPASSLTVLIIDWVYYLHMFLGYLILAWFILALGARSDPCPPQAVMASSVLWLPALVALVLYSLSCNLGGPYPARYFPPFVLLTVLSFLLSVRLPDTKRAGRALLVSTALLSTIFISHFAVQCVRDVLSINEQVDTCGQVTKALYRLGIKRGDEVGHLGFRRLEWARAAGLQIVCELPQPEEFWIEPKERQERIIAVMRSQGIKAIVLSPERPFDTPMMRVVRFVSRRLGIFSGKVPKRPPPPSDLEAAGWVKVGDTGYYILKM